MIKLTKILGFQWPHIMHSKLIALERGQFPGHYFPRRSTSISPRKSKNSKANIDQNLNNWSNPRVFWEFWQISMEYVYTSIKINNECFIGYSINSRLFSYSLYRILCQHIE